MQNYRVGDRKWINQQTYLYYANTNESELSLPVRGIVVELPGLGGGSCLGGNMERSDYITRRTRAFGEKGVLVVYPFVGPWSWGNRGAVRIADAVVDAVAQKYGLGENPRVAVCGGSMGGLGALNYAAYSRYKVCIAVAACPCVDVLDRLNCHADFPRTYVSAIAAYDMPLEEALMEISPMHIVARMPKIPYFICSDGADEIFSEAQCEAYVDLLRAAGHCVEYHRQPELTHGGFLPEVRNRLHEVIEQAILS